MLVLPRCGTTSAKSVVESVFRSHAVRGRVDAEERCHPLLIDQFTLSVLVSTVDDDGGPIVRPAKPMGLARAIRWSPGVDRTVEPGSPAHREQASSAVRPAPPTAHTIDMKTGTTAKTGGAIAAQVPLDGVTFVAAA